MKYAVRSTKQDARRVGGDGMEWEGEGGGVRASQGESVQWRLTPTW